MHPISITGILCLVAIGVIGILIHQVLTIRKLRRQSANLVTDVNLHSYLHNEWDNILLSFLACVAAGVVYNEIAAKADDYSLAKWAANFPKLFFIAVGIAGDSIIMSFNGKTQQMINDEIGALAVKNTNPYPNETP